MKLIIWDHNFVNSIKQYYRARRTSIAVILPAVFVARTVTRYPGNILITPSLCVSLLAYLIMRRNRTLLIMRERSPSKSSSRHIRIKPMRFNLQNASISHWFVACRTVTSSDWTSDNVICYRAKDVTIKKVENIWQWIIFIAIPLFVQDLRANRVEQVGWTPFSHSPSIFLCTLWNQMLWCDLRYK